jgi:hypothetical protein
MYRTALITGLEEWPSGCEQAGLRQIDRWRFEGLVAQALDHHLDHQEDGFWQSAMDSAGSQIDKSPTLSRYSDACGRTSNGLKIHVSTVRFCPCPPQQSCVPLTRISDFQVD